MKEKEILNRAKTWQVAFFSFNNTASNTNLAMMSFFMVFTQNVLGMVAVLVGAIATGMRVFDAITDPIVGAMIDRLDGKFGKYRPFMVFGSLLMNVSMLFIFFCPQSLSMAGKLAYIIFFYAIYVLGYTCQTCVTKGGQTALTSDPKQRPLFTIFDGIASSAVNAGLSLFLTTVLAPRFEGGLLNPELWRSVVLIAIGIQILFTILAIIGIWAKDRTEFFGLGDGAITKLSLKEAIFIVKENKGLRYLMLSANTEKIGWMIYNSTVVYFYANILANSSLQGTVAMVAMIPTILATTLGPMIARKKGMKKVYVISNVGSLICIAGIFLLRPSVNYSFLLLVCIVLERACSTVSVYLSNPMIADCTDYELYLTERYIPGMVGAVFSFADKFVSSLSTFVLGIALAVAGYGNKVIEPNVEASGSLYFALMLCMFGIPAVCHIVSLLSMKLYPLDGKMMLAVQEENARKELEEKNMLQKRRTKMMNARERLLCVLQGGKPDRIPVSPFVQEEYLSYYFDKKDTSRLYDAVDLCRELNFDLITRQYVNAVPYFLQRSFPDWKVDVTEGKIGNNYVRTTMICTPEGELRQVEAAEYNEKILSGIHFSTTEYMIKTEEDFAIFRKYCPSREQQDDEHILRCGEEAKSVIGDLGINCPWGMGGVFNMAATYIDIQDMLCDALSDEEYYESYMNFFTDLIVEDNKIFAKSEFDAVGIQGNIANGAIMGNEFFEQYVLPYERRALEPFLQAKKPTIYHNCGNAKVLYPSYKKLGITVWETVSPVPQGDNVLAEAKEYFGSDLILSGNFDQVRFLKNATLQEIEKAAYDQMMVGKKGGNYIFACSDYLEIGTPVENVKALLRGANAAAQLNDE